ncbi:hypothetical protein [Paludisphaera rhizosphaerae]|uniref:hypothetical protein n=1 Tax=Paludisphaera rhizosphaerae TaxID=2711216 RepID=UPI0013E9CB74|nr:hypothetical protein [Paludisphaera rhizosphaerae]
MSDLPDFDLDCEWLDPSSTAEPQPPAAAAAPVVDEPPTAKPADPVVVIQYRNRGVSPILLFPMTLIASLALFAGYHHFFVRPIYTQDGGFAFARAAEPASLAAPERDPAVAQVSTTLPIQVAPATVPLSLESQPLGPIAPVLPPPLTLEVQPAGPVEALSLTPSVVQSTETQKPEPAETPKVDAEDSKPRISIASTAVDPVKEEPPAPEADAIPAADTPTREQMMERIRQEAELKELQQRGMEQRQADAAAQFHAEDTQRIQEERVSFHKSLQEIVSVGGRDVGKAIDDLCDKYGRGYSQEKRNEVKAVMERAHGKRSRREEVGLLRYMGVPEPGVLDYLSNEVHRTSLHKRNGPQNPDEVRLFAARQLLQIGPDAPPPRVTGDTPQPQVNRSVPMRRGR